MRIMRATALIFTLLVLVGCSGMTSKGGSAVYPSMKGISTDFKNASLVKKKLFAQYKGWKGTKYKIGGLSKKGIDCSGFVFLTFRSKFAIKLPRTTDLQAKIGTPVPQNQLVPGDLLFFKTGINKRHTGIYLGNRRFVHASSSRGVTISSLDNGYWSSKYWKAKRVMP